MESEVEQDSSSQETGSEVVQAVEQWPAEMKATQQITDPENNEQRTFEKDEKLIIVLDEGVHPDALSEEDLVITIPASDPTKAFSIPAGMMNLGSQPVTNHRCNFDSSNLNLPDLPASLVKESWIPRGQQILRGVIYTLSKNAEILTQLGMGEDFFNLLKKDSLLVSNKIWNATHVALKIALQRGIFDINKVPYIHKSIGQEVDEDSREKYEDAMVVFAERVVTPGRISMRISYHKHFRFYITGSRFANETLQKEIGEPPQAAEVYTYRFCSFPMEDDPRIGRFAAEAWTMIFNCYSEDLKNPGVVFQNPTELTLRISLLRSMRRHVLKQLGTKFSLKNVDTGFNNDSHLIERTAKVKESRVRIRRPWSMQNLGPIRRYTLMEGFKVNTAVGEPMIEIFRDLKFRVPDAIVNKSVEIQLIYVEIDITTNKQPHATPTARCVGTGAIDNLHEANAVSIQLTSRLPTGWSTLTFQRRRSNHHAKTIQYRNVAVPAVYIEAMRIINTFERRQYMGDMPAIVAKYDDINLVEVQQSYLDNTTTLSVINGAIEPSYPVPQIVSLAANTLALRTQLPNVIVGTMPENLRSRPQGSNSSTHRKICDVCYGLLYRWEAPVSTSTVSTRNTKCKVVNGKCERWAHLNIPATFTEESDAHFARMCELLWFKPIDMTLIPCSDPRIGAFDLDGEGVEAVVSPSPDDDDDNASDKAKSQPSTDSSEESGEIETEEEQDEEDGDKEDEDEDGDEDEDEDENESAEAKPVQIISTWSKHGRVWVRARYDNGVVDVKGKVSENFKEHRALLKAYYRNEGRNRKQPEWLE